MASTDMTFIEFLQSHRRGELVNTGDKMLQELLQAVTETGLKGEITIKLPFTVNKAGQIECQPKVELKKPSRPMGVGIYFASEDHRLTRSDPNQLDMMDELQERRNAAE